MGKVNEEKRVLMMFAEEKSFSVQYKEHASEISERGTRNLKAFKSECQDII